MTTETESLEALHLWLATELPELRYVGSHKRCARTYAPNRCYYEKWWSQVLLPCDGRGWQAKVTTDGIDEALMALGYHVSRARVNDEYRTLYSWPDDSSRSQLAYAATAHESACRAARKALEAAS